MMNRRKSIEMIYDTDFLTLYLKIDLKIIELHWKPQSISLSDEQFMEHIVVLTGFIEQYKVSGLLINCIDFFNVVSIALQEWHDKEIVPRKLAAGLKKEAFIMPNDLVSSLSIEQALDESNAKVIDAKYFNDFDDALEWITKG